MSSYAAVGLRYGRAIFELGSETGTLEQLVERLTDFAEVYSSSAELRAVLENPLVEAPKRRAILEDVGRAVGLSELGLNAVNLLAQRRKLAALPEVARTLRKLSDERAGVVRATVTTATHMPDSFFDRLKADLESVTQRRVVIDRQQDPSLIAGVVTRIGDNTIDGSVRGRLQEMARTLRNY